MLCSDSSFFFLPDPLLVLVPQEKRADRQEALCFLDFEGFKHHGRHDHFRLRRYFRTILLLLDEKEAVRCTFCCLLAGRSHSFVEESIALFIDQSEATRKWQNRLHLKSYFKATIAGLD